MVCEEQNPVPSGSSAVCRGDPELRQLIQPLDLEAGFQEEVAFRQSLPGQE